MAGYRGERDCIFKDADSAGGFCPWHDSMRMKLGLGEDPLDSIEICRLCTEQNQMKTVSFIGTLMKELKQMVERTFKMKGM